MKKEAAKVEVLATFMERVPFKPKPEIKLEGRAAFVKQAKAAKQPSSLKAKSDPIQDRRPLRLGRRDCIEENCYSAYSISDAVAFAY